MVAFCRKMIEGHYKRWGKISNFVGLWALMSAFTITYSNTACEVYRSKGLPKISLILQVIYMFLYVPVIYHAANQNFQTLCIASCLVRGVPIILDFVVLRVKFRISFFSIVKNTYIQFIAAGIMALFGYEVTKWMNGVAIQLVSVLLCIVIYFGIIFCFSEMRKEYGIYIRKFLKLNKGMLDNG